MSGQTAETPSSEILLSPGSPSRGDIELATTKVSLQARVRSSLALPVLVVMLTIVLLGATRTSLFLSEATWTNILRSASFFVIVACFQGLVMISGGLDLSVGSSFLAGAMLAAFVVDQTGSVPLAFLASVCGGLAIGGFNGALTTVLRISPIIVTLGSLFMVRAIIETRTRGLSIGPLPDHFTRIASPMVGFVPGVFIYAVLVAGIAHVILEYTEFGTHVRATGGDRDAAEKVGINVRATSFILYAACGAFAALAGLLQAASLGAGAPSFGTGMELKVIAAAVIGGVSIYGAVGTIPGIVSGSVLLSVITVGIVLLRIPGSMQNFVVGFVLIVAVVADRIRQTRKFRVTVSEKVDEPAPANAGHS